MNPAHSDEEGQALEIARLIQDLKSYDVAVRFRAKEALVRIGDAAVEHLVKAYQPFIQDPQQDEGEFRWVIAEVLARIGGEAAITLLRKTLKHPDHRIRWGIAITLGRIGDQRAEEELIAALEDEDRDVRKLTIDVLGQLRGERVLATLIQFLDDEDRYVRARAAASLGKTRDTRAHEALCRALKTATRLVVLNAIRGALAELKGKN